MTDVTAIDVRLTTLEKTVPEGLRRIEDLILREIHDLKTEQIRDIKNAIERVESDTKNGLSRIEDGLKEEITRIADDQRRLWEHVGKLELKASERTGGSKTLDRLWSVMSVLIGGAVAIGGSWLSASHVPHP